MVFELVRTAEFIRANYQAEVYSFPVRYGYNNHSITAIVNETKGTKTMNLPAEFILCNGRLIDPSQNLDDMGWLHVRDGKIVKTQSGTDSPNGIPAVDVNGMIIAPGLIDMHVHLREPGAPHKETIESGSKAAAAGGFTTVCCMPNTNPTIDNVETLSWVKHRAAEVGLCDVQVVAAATVDRKGQQPVEFPALKEAGAIAFSDDGDGIDDDDVCRRVMEGVKNCDSVFAPHCEFKNISHKAAMHLGSVSRKLGVEGYDPLGEETMIERDLALVEEIGLHYHVTHISTARGVEMVRRAKDKGLPVTAEVCPHHLLLTHEQVVDEDGKPNPNFKMSPPLRDMRDIVACVQAVRDGTIDCIVTDHAPHAVGEKQTRFTKAPMGIIGLETSLPCSVEALLDESYSWPDLIRSMSTSPARVLRIPAGTLKPRRRADIVIIDPHRKWTIDPDKFLSLSRNTPYVGKKVTGKAVLTIYAGKPTYIDSDFELPSTT